MTSEKTFRLIYLRKSIITDRESFINVVTHSIEEKIIDSEHNWMGRYDSDRDKTVIVS